MRANGVCGVWSGWRFISGHTVISISMSTKAYNYMQCTSIWTLNFRKLERKTLLCEFEIFAVQCPLDKTLEWKETYSDFCYFKFQWQSKAALCWCQPCDKEAYICYCAVCHKVVFDLCCARMQNSVAYEIYDRESMIESAVLHNK